MSTQTNGRFLVVALLAMGAAAVLSGACGSDDETGATSGTTTQNNPIGGATSASTGAGAGATSSTTGGMGGSGGGTGGAGGQGAGPECTPYDNSSLPLDNGMLPPLP